MPSQTELRKQITAKIIAALEGNILPWRKSWVSVRKHGATIQRGDQAPLFRHQSPSA